MGVSKTAYLFIAPHNSAYKSSGYDLQNIKVYTEGD